MNMTITEKIVARASGKSEVSPGEIINADIDIALTHDVMCGPTADEFRQIGINRVWDADKIVVTPDHFIPARDIATAQLYKAMEAFVKQQNIKNYFPVGQHGICHVMLPQEGFVKPGIVIVGTDSHTCTHGALGAFATGIGTTDMAAVFATGNLWFRVPESMKIIVDGKIGEQIYAKDIILHIISELGVDGALYRAMEFTGPVVKELSMDERFVLCNMSIEAGAKNGIVNPDEKSHEYLKNRGVDYYDTFESDSDADYIEEIRLDISDLEPSVAVPFLPSNVKTARELTNIMIHQAVIGSCTGGRMTDLRVAARILQKNSVNPSVSTVETKTIKTCKYI